MKKFLAIFLIVFFTTFCFPINNFISGYIFEDLNKNRLRDENEKGLIGIPVSNEEDVILTDENGKYTIPFSKIIFAIKPAEYRFHLNDNNIPEFYYNFSKNSTDEKESYDFPMISENRTEEFEIYVFGDTQVSGPDEINYLMKCISSIDREKPLFVITEGDNVYNTLNLYPEYLKAMSTMNLPIYYVPGNHDLNFESKNDEFSLNTFNDLVSPSYYSFNYGKIHFVVLDDVFWDGKSYHGEFGEKQLNWLKNDLKYVPEDILIVLNMHIPLCSFARNSDDNKVHDSSELFKILKNKKVLSLAGHTHTLERYESGDFLEGWDKSPSLSSNNHRSGLRFMVDGEN